MPRCLQTTAMASRRGSFPETIACRMSSRRRLVDFPGIGNDPIQGLLFAREAIDATLVTVMITDEDVPARSLLVRERQHYGLFSRFRHGANMRRNRIARQSWRAGRRRQTPVRPAQADIFVRV